MAAKELSDFPVHLGIGASAVVQPQFTGSVDWYADYSRRHADDGIEGRLVSLHTFSEPWGLWEVHPHGSELVLCISGSITLLQEQPDGSVVPTMIQAGEYAINEPGIWHTADVDGEATALFITAGSGTEHRQR